MERVKRTRNKVAWSVWRRKMNAYASSVVQTSFSGAFGRMVAAEAGGGDPFYSVMKYLKLGHT